MASTTRDRRPTWELVDFFPHQGDWRVESYLALETNRLIEYTDGFLEILPMPEEIHAFVQEFILRTIQAFLKARRRGVAMYAPFKVRVRHDAFREPDVCVLNDESDRRRGRKYWSGADMVVEVVSPGGEARDYFEKRSDYAEANIPEYWIVDPFKKELTVLRLMGAEYAVHGVIRPGQVAESSSVNGLKLDVAECFAAADQASPNDEPPGDTER